MLEIGRPALPPRARPAARLTVMDVTKWFGETSGGVKTYLSAKAAYVERNADLRHVLVIPGAEDEIVEGHGTRTYKLRGPLVPAQKQYRFLLATRSLRRIVEHERPDIVEVGSQFFVPWVTRLATRHRALPVVGFYHANMERAIEASLGYPELGGPPSRTLMRNYLRTVDRLFAARFAASDSLAADLNAAGIRNVSRVRLGVDSNVFHPDRQADRAATRHRLGLSDRDPMVVYCGRIAVEKDIEWVLRRWQDGAAPGVWLVVIGDGALRERLMQRTVRDGTRVKWLPFESDRMNLARLFASADAVLCPGPVETFGLTTLEAMACGTPLICVDTGAGAELVRRSGGGLTYRWRDARDFAATVRRVLTRDRAAYAKAGRDYAVSRHRWNQAFDELFEIYERLAGVNAEARRCA